MSDAQHIDRVVEVASHPSAAARSRLAASWRRSFDHHGLDPGQKAGVQRVTAEALTERRERSEAMLRVAAPKLDAIRFHGGEIHPVDDPRTVYEVSQRLADETGGHYLDQFTFAERATDWRGNNNIAESIFAQMAEEEYPVPEWVVCGAGTGGTSATIGRYIAYQRHATRLCVADPVHSIFHRHYHDRTATSLPPGCASRIEGIGRPRLEPSFVPSVIDRMIPVEDADSIGAMRALSDRLGRRVGGSTGTNLVACVKLIAEMEAAGAKGSIVTVLCDGGERYSCTYYDDDWLESHAIDWRPSYQSIGNSLSQDLEPWVVSPKIGTRVD